MKRREVNENDPLDIARFHGQPVVPWPEQLDPQMPTAVPLGVYDIRLEALKN